MLTLDEVKKELGIDFNDHDNRLERYIQVAKQWLDGSISKYDEKDERAKQLALFIIEDLYDRNANTVKENITISKLKNDFIMQLQNEGRDNGSLQQTDSHSKIR